MIQYLIRRILIGVFTLLLITFVIYALVRHMPGNPLTLDLAEQDPRRQMSEADKQRLIKLYGLDKPWYVAYFDWIGNVARGNLGDSIPRKQSVATLIKQRVGPTLLLSVTSLLLAYVLSVPLGLWSTVRSGKVSERFVTTALYMLYSLPSFVAALLLQIVLAVHLNWLPLFGMVSDNYAELTFGGKVWDVFTHMLMPVICFTYGALAYETRFIKSNMNEVIRQDYIRTAKAKGVSNVAIVVKHAFRNTLIPLVTLIGLTLPGLLSGAVILEQIFSWPGMGRLFFEAILGRDYQTVMGLTLIFSILTLGGQLLADVLYAVVDPRVTYS